MTGYSVASLYSIAICNEEFLPKYLHGSLFSRTLKCLMLDFDCAIKIKRRKISIIHLLITFVSTAARVRLGTFIQQIYLTASKIYDSVLLQKSCDKEYRTDFFVHLFLSSVVFTEIKMFNLLFYFKNHIIIFELL